MDEHTQKVFDAIIKKDVSALIPSDIVFLRARQSYLTEEQLALYAPLFNVKTEPVVEAVTEVPKERTIADYSMKELYKRAKELGCKTRVGLKRDELIKMIDDCYVL